MKANELQKGVGFLIAKDLAEIDFDFGCSGTHVSLAVDFKKLKPEELRGLKRTFGPLKARVESWGSFLDGERTLDDGYVIKLAIGSAFECKELLPEDLDDVKLDEIRQKILEGTIKIRDCTPNVLEPDEGDDTPPEPADVPF